MLFNQLKIDNEGINKITLALRFSIILFHIAAAGRMASWSSASICISVLYIVFLSEQYNKIDGYKSGDHEGQISYKLVSHCIEFPNVL